MLIRRSQIVIQIALLVTISLPIVVIASDETDQIKQSDINATFKLKGAKAAFEEAFEAGDEKSEQKFEASQGVGINVGGGRRFTRFPRADLKGPGEWATHFPLREGGANATSCVSCHNSPIANGAGDISGNVVVDPAHTGDPSRYLERNTLPMVALGPVQRIAEEMSTELYYQRGALAKLACADGEARTALQAKKISFGYLTAKRTHKSPCNLMFDTTELEGIDKDLVVKAFGWKGNKATIRDFTRSAAHNELGMQAVEIVGSKDGDYDGVVNELSVGDLTALTVYLAALERPVTKSELNTLGLAKFTKAEQEKAESGRNLFARVGCATCHTPQLPINNPVFAEPSETPGFFDVVFPDGSNPVAHGVSADTAIRFDMTKDQPNNRIANKEGGTTLLGAVPVTKNGVAMVNWFSDFKRHDMGPDLADPDDPLGIGAQMWLTRSLAGVGSTGPWLHDGRATTLNEAIIAHGGEGTKSRDGYVSLPAEQQRAIVAFLESLVIFKHEEPGEEDH